MTIRRVGLALIATAGVAGADDGANKRATVDVVPAGHAFTVLTVDNPLGDVRVEGYDGTAIRIDTREHAPDEDTLDRLRVSLVSSSADGAVRITTTADGGREVKPVSRGAVRIDLVIHAPRAVRVDTTTNAGTLAVENMDNGGELDTASGPITVKNVQGELFTHSVSGPTSLVQVFGSVDAQSLSSDVDLDTINGDKLVATVDHGKIAGRRVRARDVELTANDGKIVLEAESSLRGRIRVASQHGDVEVKLHRHGAVSVRAVGVKVDLGAESKEHDGWRLATFGTISEDTASIELRSRYGNVLFAIVE
jgi:hypothetical protein